MAGGVSEVGEGRVVIVSYADTGGGFAFLLLLCLLAVGLLGWVIYWLPHQLPRQLPHCVGSLGQRGVSDPGVDYHYGDGRASLGAYEWVIDWPCLLSQVAALALVALPFMRAKAEAPLDPFSSPFAKRA